MLGDNGHDYKILINAVPRIKGIEGMTCELGLREGGGSKYIIDGLLDNHDYDRTHIAIDPYGNIEYRLNERQTVRSGYNNDMKDRALKEMHEYIHDKRINFVFFCLEDTEFFNRFSDGVPIYNNDYKTMCNKYALVYFDACHTVADVKLEVEFYLTRTDSGAIFVFDDIDGSYYDHSPIADILFANNWERLEQATHKVSYRKM